jgi:DnaJ-class molecular chaperone
MAAEVICTSMCGLNPTSDLPAREILILSDEHVDMVSAALGTEIEVETVDGVVTMKVPPGTQSGTDFKLSGHGVANSRNANRGAHIVTMLVDTPTKLSKAQQELLQELPGGNTFQKAFLEVVSGSLLSLGLNPYAYMR